MKHIANRIFVFKVALEYQKRVWRKIAIRGDHSLAVHHDAIFEAFKRYDEHLYSFYFSSKPTSTSRTRLLGARQYGCPYSEADDDEAEYPSIESLRLPLKAQFEYLFDYGDQWWHEITLEEIQEPRPDCTYPCVIAASKGEPPPQYEDADD